MSRVWVRANIKDTYVEAEFEGWVEPDDWRRVRMHRGIVVPVHVTRILSLQVRVVGGVWFEPRTEISDLVDGESHAEAEELLRRKWLSGDPAWLPYVFGTELHEIEPPDAGAEQEG